MKHAMFVMAMLLAGAVSGQEPQSKSVKTGEWYCVTANSTTGEFSMVKGECPPSPTLEQRIAALEKRVAELEAWHRSEVKVQHEYTLETCGQDNTLFPRTAARCKELGLATPAPERKP